MAAADGLEAPGPAQRPSWTCVTSPMPDLMTPLLIKVVKVRSNECASAAMSAAVTIERSPPLMAMRSRTRLVHQLDPTS